MDRASADIYDGDETLYMPMAKTLSPENQNLKLSCQGGDARIISLNVEQLTSAWKWRHILCLKFEGFRQIKNNRK